MKVSELAEELGVPASAVIEQCQRFSIDASWAGAELKGSDVAVLRAELAGIDDVAAPPAEGTDAPPSDAPAPDPGAAAPAGPSDPPAAPADDITAPRPAVPAGEALTGGGRGRSPLPPTAVGSMPDLIDEVTPEPVVEPPSPGGPGPGPTLQPAGPSTYFDEQGNRRVGARPAPATRTLERSAVNAVGWGVLGIALVAASNAIANPWAVAVLWLGGAFAFAVAVFDGNRARRSITTHPDRRRGLPFAVIGAVLGVAGLVAVSSLVYLAVRDEPADSAPLGAGDLAAVDSARWGYLRITRIIDEGWSTPAKAEGSCWEDDDDLEVRDDERVEVGNRIRPCGSRHTVEIARVFPMSREADAPYPSAAAVIAEVEERCAGLWEDAREAAAGADVQLRPEVPTEEGWRRGDRDVACALVTAPREGALLDEG
jgi:hypothetical protein